MAQLMVAAQRLCLTADRQKLVTEGDPRAAFLYAAVGDEIPHSAVEKFGLVDGKLPMAAEAEDADEAKRKAAEEEAGAAFAAALAEAQRRQDEEAAAAEAKRLADEAAAAEAERKAAEDAAAAEAEKKAAEDGGNKEDGEGTTKEAKPGKTKG